MEKIVTPCVGVCMLNEARSVCLGCGRTLKEIAYWLRLSDEERRAIMARLDSKEPAGRSPPPPARQVDPLR